MPVPTSVTAIVGCDAGAEQGIKFVPSKITRKPCGCGARKEKLNNPELKINKLLYKK
jgi:hypothetical protein